MTSRHAGAQPVYAPNSYGGPEADPERAGAVAWSVGAGELGRYAYDKHAEDDDFGQAGALVRKVMDDTDRAHLVTNIVAHASNRVTDEVQLRVIAYWTSVDAWLGARVAEGLGRDVDSAAFKEATRVVEQRSNRA
jgi:catalase